MINRVAVQEKADLIIVGSHGASGLERLVLGSIAESILHHAICPTLIVGPNCVRRTLLQRENTCGVW
ncbi:universal stress protein [Edaphobacter modestus]|uniref:universal stress protein n=1 Tax=Edaphobacter modestus TaxID=388466 RepID=UPI00102CA780